MDSTVYSASFQRRTSKILKIFILIAGITLVGFVISMIPVTFYSSNDDHQEHIVENIFGELMSLSYIDLGGKYRYSSFVYMEAAFFPRMGLTKPSFCSMMIAKKEQ